MSKPLLVIGSSGQLARALRTLRPEAIYLSRTDMDLSIPHQVTKTLEKYDPCAIVNAAAYTQVDNAELEEKLAVNVNCQSPAAMAIYCAERAIPLVHFSTDYVFDGSGIAPWKEDDSPAPLNAYGRSKLGGEDAIAKIGGKYLILRTSWLYDAYGKNFFNTILRLAAEREELRVIDDQYGAPTYVPHLASAVLKALDAATEQELFPCGIYHLASAGETTWYGFASAILEQARAKEMQLKVRSIIPILARDYPLPAPRPHNSRLDCIKALSMFGVMLPDWQEGLTDCLGFKS